MTDLKRVWLIFDGDNTLWHSESLYDNARDMLCALLAKRGHNPAKTHNFQQQRDKELFQILGYSRKRFAKSLVDTLLHFEPRASGSDIELVRALALNVFSSPAPSDEHAGPVLRRLSKTYSLALLTAGDRQIQAARISAFPFTNLFQKIEIIPSKNKEALSAFLFAQGIPGKESIVVGDSLRSDSSSSHIAFFDAQLKKVRTIERKGTEIISESAQSEQISPKNQK